MVNIDDHTEFVRKSDDHGFLKFYIRESAKTITAKVLSKPNEHTLEHNHHSSLGLMPVEDLPKRFHFNFISLPVLVSMRLLDSYFDKRPIAHATVAVSINDNNQFFEVTTDREGKAIFDMPTSTYKVTLQILDATEDVIDPIFELHDDCSDFLDLNKVDLKILERMYTMEIATASCHDFNHYSDVPVLVHLGYDFEDKHHHRHHNIHDEQDSKRLLIQAPHGFDHEEHRSEYVLVSNSDGYIKLRVHESAANVTLTVVGPPPYNTDIANLGLIAKDDLPEKFDFVFFALPKELVVSVRDARTDDTLFGAEVIVKYFDHTTDHHVSKTGISDHDGKAKIRVDGCVEFATFIVTPPPRQFCDGPPYSAEKRLHWNIMTDQRFQIGLDETHHKDVHITVRTNDEVRHIDEMKYTAELGGQDAHGIHRPDPFFQNWHLTARKSDRRLNLLTVASRENTMGLTVINLCCVNDDEIVDIFDNSIEVITEIFTTLKNRFSVSRLCLLFAVSCNLLIKVECVFRNK
jgi:hypothetical protein